LHSADPQIYATATWRPGLCAPELRFITLSEVSKFHDSKGWMGRMEAGSPVVLEFASAVWRAMDITVCLQRGMATA
jgi:hypothetical protein